MMQVYLSRLHIEIWGEMLLIGRAVTPTKLELSEVSCHFIKNFTESSINVMTFHYFRHLSNLNRNFSHGISSSAWRSGDPLRYGPEPNLDGDSIGENGNDLIVGGVKVVFGLHVLLDRGGRQRQLGGGDGVVVGDGGSSDGGAEGGHHFGVGGEAGFDGPKRLARGIGVDSSSGQGAGFGFGGQDGLGGGFGRGGQGFDAGGEGGGGARFGVAQFVGPSFGCGAIVGGLSGWWHL